MSWEHASDMKNGYISVIHLSTGDHYPGFYRLEFIETGRSRVFWGYRLTILCNEKTYIGQDRHHAIDALRSCAVELARHDLAIRVAGLHQGFFETGLSYNSGYGYIKGSREAWHIMTALDDLEALPGKRRES